MTKKSYIEFVAELKRHFGDEEAMRLAVGGDYVAVGSLQRELLESLGLRDGHCVVDVGCGSGRLGFQLKGQKSLVYVGLDVVPDLVAYAKRICERVDWHFHVTEGTVIRHESVTADFVCFFSVFTHLLHEDTYRYLQEAMRVLKPGGRVVFSFLEFRLAAHWAMFNQNSGHLNQFIERDAIYAWARRLGFIVENIFGGDQPHIPLKEAITWDSGTVMERFGNLGQSVVVFRLPGAAGRSRGNDEVNTAAVSPAAVSAIDRKALLSVRSYVAPGAMNLRFSFELPSPCDVFVRASTQSLREQGYGHLLPTPSVLFFDHTGSAIAGNAGWKGLPPPTQRLAEHFFASRTPSLPLSDSDAVLWLQLPAGRYSIGVAGDGAEAGLVDVDVNADTHG